MFEVEKYPVTADWAKRAWIDADKYREMYRRSVEDPDGFWAEHGKRVDWIKPFTRVKDTSFDRANVSIEWFGDGTLNACANCIDRHLPRRADQTAIIWEGDDPAEDKHITYRELHEEVCRFANVLKAMGARKGDRITIYMPMIPEAAYAMLACARIPTRWPAGSGTANRNSSSPPTRACAADGPFRSRPTPTRRSPPAPAASRCWWSGAPAMAST
jgi:acetyl-CoA synthetase